MTGEQNGNGTGIFTISRYGNNAVAPSSNSASNLVGERSKTATLRKKFEHDRKFTIILFVICIILAIAVVAMAASYVITKNRLNAKGRICESDQCIRSAANLKLSMNTTVDPCEDFYRYTCDRWTAEHQDHGWFSQNSAFAIIEEKVTFAALKFFQTNETKNEPKPVKQCRNMYKACMNLEARDKLSYKPIFKYLAEMGLPAFPTFMNLSDEDVDFKKFKYDWIKVEAAMTRILDLQLFLGFTVDANVYNTSRNSIVMGVPTMQSPLPSPLKSSKRHNKFIRFDHLTVTKTDDDDDDDDDEDESEIAEAYKKFMQFVIQEVVEANCSKLPDDFDDRLELTVDVIFKMQAEINQIRPENETQSDFYIGLTANELQDATNKLLKALDFKEYDVWKPFLLQVFKGLNITLDLEKRDLIYVDPEHLQYLFTVVGFLGGIPDVVVELWVWWMAVQALIINTTTEVKEYFDKLSAPFQNIFLRSKAVNCAVLVNDFMGMAVSYALADKTFLNETKPRIQQMLGDIKEAFAMRVNEISWMDQETKKATLEKSAEMISFIGYPDWFTQEGAIELYYSNVTISIDNHLDNMVGIIKLFMTGVLESLHVENERNWHSDPTTVNAYNFFLDNSITVPMAILFFPLYNLGLEVLNYGAIGSILGHELTHGFDNTGRKYDKFGNYRQWWSNSTIEKFENLTKCFVKQYDSFYVPEIDTHIDGKLTLGENIADNGGIHHAYVAYRNYIKRNIYEPVLPGFEEFTHDQLFFIAFGSIWCDETNPTVLKYQVTDEHCPNKYRVIGSLVNSKEFSNAFNCPKGTNMNPDKDKCRIW